MHEYRAEAVQSVTRERPSRPPEVRSDVAVPLAQAVVTATLVAVGVLMLWWPGWRAAALVWWVVALAVWLWRSEAIQRTLWQIESITMRDLDGDKRVGQPEQTVLQLEDDSGWRNVHVAHPPDKLGRFAQMLLDGKPMSEQAYTGRGKPFSRGEWNAMRDALLEAHAVEWCNPQHHTQGFQAVDTDSARRRLQSVAAGGRAHVRTHVTGGGNVQEACKAGKGAS